MRLTLFLASILAALTATGQFSIAEPAVNSGPYTITDTVYMATDGDDNDPGTFDKPVKSFQAALDLLPYGQAGINGGNAYGLIMLKAGNYEVSSGFHQFPNKWKNGNTYKNVSLEGMGNVTIGGERDSFANSHLLILSGNHIFIKNLTLRYATGIGILLNRNEDGRQHNVRIEDVTVDSVGNFSMLLRNVDTILVRNCRSLYASRPGNDHLTSPCQWPSGIKFFGSSECKIYDSEIGYTRGEGLNFHNSIRGEAYNNKLHDNGLNFYNDNSAKLQVHHNLIYNTPDIGSTYWRNCPSDTDPTWAGRGMLIANEGACDAGNTPTFSNCYTNCILPNEKFSNIDSMFVYNNIFQNLGGGIGFWQGNTNIAGANCIRNVFIFNNTFIGALGMNGAGSTGFINFFFPSYNVVFNNFYSYLENVNITHNIFSWDTVAYPNIIPVSKTFHALHPGPKDINFDFNLWKKTTAEMGPNGEHRPGLIDSTYLLTDSVTSILPCPDQMELVLSDSAAFSFMENDFDYTARLMDNTNVGALEYRSECKDFTSINNQINNSSITLFPNPCQAGEIIQINGLKFIETCTYQLFNLQGRQIQNGSIQFGKIQIDITSSPGIYLLKVINSKAQFISKIIVL